MKKSIIMLILLLCSACMPVNFTSTAYFVPGPDVDSTPSPKATPVPSPTPTVTQVLTFPNECEKSCEQITDTVWARREGANLVLFKENTCHGDGFARSKTSLVVNPNLTLTLSLDPTSNTLIVTEIVTN